MVSIGQDSDCHNAGWECEEHCASHNLKGEVSGCLLTSSRIICEDFVGAPVTFIPLDPNTHCELVRQHCRRVAFCSAFWRRCVKGQRM